MSGFPRTTVGGVSIPRLICGSNTVFGVSHFSRARDLTLKQMFDTPGKVADVIEVFARHGCNAFMSGPDEFLSQALREVEQRTGRPMIWVATPWYKEGIADLHDAWKQAVDETRAYGAAFCWPHAGMTDPLVDRNNQVLSPLLLEHLEYVREAGMVPGLSTHTPTAIISADNCEGAVEGYVQPFNAAGFLCETETDWVQYVIEHAEKPVLVIKPLAAGRLMPPTGLSFVWNNIRECDAVVLGTMSAYEAEESIELSLAIIEKRYAQVDLHRSRSKKALIT